MKQAILITAYKDLQHLLEIINFFDHDFSFYIHIDKKSLCDETELQDLRQFKNVKFIGKRFKTNWGGLNHLKAILFLIRTALEDQENFYFHLISGSDFPIKSPKQFKNFFQINKEKEYIDYFEIPFKGWGDSGGMDRIAYFNFFDLWNYKVPKERYRIRRFLDIQRVLGYRRTLSSKMPQLYGGSTWWSMSRSCCDYLIKFTDQNKFVLKRFKYTFCSEEFYVQTVIVNSQLKSRVDRNCLRYIDWNSRNGSRPAVLDDTDVEKLLESDAFFARKFEDKESIALRNKLIFHIKNSV